MERVPRQDGALHARGQVLYTREHREAAEVIGLARGVERAGGHASELLHQTLRFGDRLAFDAGGHHRGGGLADGAGLAFESDVLDGVAGDLHREPDVIAA